jgi:hypothetical protein
MYLYRGDSRTPEVIKRDGFVPWARYAGGSSAILERMQQDVVNPGGGTLAGLLWVLRDHTPDAAKATARIFSGASFGDYIYYMKIAPLHAFEFSKAGVGTQIMAGNFDFLDCLLLDTAEPAFTSVIALHHSAKTAPTKEVTFYTSIRPQCVLWYSVRPQGNAKPEWKSMADVVVAPPAVKGIGEGKFKALKAKFGG